jgi:hypothetical protein
VDPDGVSLDATAGAVLVVGVSFGMVEGAGAITVTSDGAPFGAGAGLDKSVALDGTTLGVMPGADRIGLGTSGGTGAMVFSLVTKTWRVLLGHSRWGLGWHHYGSLAGGAWRHRDWPPAGQIPDRG